MKGILVDCELENKAKTDGNAMCPDDHFVETIKSRGKMVWCIHNGKICPYLLLKVTGD
tara:strand:- start:257 stop:430 length:174 start_codon:yes stop_codon:yes gene_type:complete